MTGSPEIIPETRGWAGLAQQGRIQISMDELRSGRVLSEILSHESAHDVMLGTQLGWVERVLSTPALPPFPDGRLQQTTGALLALGTRSSWLTHEGTASFLPSLIHEGEALDRYWSLHRPDYIDAARPLEWLRARPMDRNAIERLVLNAAQVALSLPIADDWSEHQLSDVSALHAYLSDPRYNPDARYYVLLGFLSQLPDDELRALSEMKLDETVRAIEYYSGSNRTPPFAVLPDPPGEAWIASLAERMAAALRTSASSDGEHQYLDSLRDDPLLAIQLPAPTMLSVVITETGASSGEIARDVDPPMDKLLGYKHVRMLHNMYDLDVPGVEPMRAEPMMLRPGDTAVWAESPGMPNRAAHLSPAGLRAYLDVLPADVTVCVRDGAYLFGVAAGEDQLRRRRHVVLVQHQTPFQLALQLGVTGLDASGAMVATVMDSDNTDVRYVLIRPATGQNPIVILPTAPITVERLYAFWARDDATAKVTPIDPPQFLDVPDPKAAVVDVTRVLATFERVPWPPGI